MRGGSTGSSFGSKVLAGGSGCGRVLGEIGNGGISRGGKGKGVGVVGLIELPGAPVLPAFPAFPALPKSPVFPE